MSQVTDLNVPYSAATGFLAARLQFTQDAARVEGSSAAIFSILPSTTCDISIGGVFYVKKTENQPTAIVSHRRLRRSCACSITRHSFMMIS